MAAKKNNMKTLSECVAWRTKVDLCTNNLLVGGGSTSLQKEMGVEVAPVQLHDTQLVTLNPYNHIDRYIGRYKYS